MLGQFSPGDPYSALSTTPPWDPAHLLQPFRFRSRTEPIDWRRLSALDVERVERDMDVDVLQNFITTVTFCAVEGERCPNCRGPADPSLIKLLRMSQLSTEYLLHCQDMLSSQLSGLEERLQAALSLVQRGEEQRTELEKNLQEAKQENRRRKKLIDTQQLLLQTSANNYHKCQFCEKSFVNYSYLQAHVQRRHPEVTDAEKQKKRKAEEMEDRIEELKEKLKLTQMQLQVEKETESLRHQQVSLCLNQYPASHTALSEPLKGIVHPKMKISTCWNTLIKFVICMCVLQLKGENARLVKALSVEKNSGSSLQKLQQQVVSLSSQLSQKDRLIKSQEEKVGYLLHNCKEWMKVNSPEEPEEEDEENNFGLWVHTNVIQQHCSVPVVEGMMFWQGTKGISKQTFKSLSALLTGQRLQRYRQQPDLHIQRDNLAREVIRRVKSLQKGQGKLTPSTLKQRGKKNSSPVKEKSLRSREGSKSSTWRAKSQQPQALVPTPTPRSNAPQNQTPKTQQKKNGTPPFSSDEDESVEDSAYITSSRGKPSPAVRLVQSGSLLNPTAEPDWTDSELSEASDTPKLHKSPNSHGSVVQTLTRSLERQLSTPVKKPVGGTRVLPPSSSSPRPVIVKQRALSDEESDLELSSIEELTANHARVHKSSEVGGTSGTSAWSSAASRPGAW
uniref:Zinc finger protein DZIP1L-like n=1 Tax=Sinocyclocheilus rhinocerous TaxID=307959 RepID=A0A673I0K9_9TELE